MVTPLISMLTTAKIIVLKIGSSLLCDAETGTVRGEWLASLADDIDRALEGGQKVIIVSSGAAALGRPFITSGRKLPGKQAASAIGQPLLMTAYGDAFKPHNRKIAQALLTLEDTENRRRWLNARATLFTLLDEGLVPVINENDTVATEEIRYGDNDRLAARIAQMIGADLLLLLSDIDGLYTEDPRKSDDAIHLTSVSTITSEIRDGAGASNQSAGVGSGGMITKLDAAEIAQGAGCATIIADGRADHPIARLKSGERHTRIEAPTSPQDARRTWLKGHLTPEGNIGIDAGAAKAIAKGSSLLPVGIQSVSGQFPRGSAVAVIDPSGATVAKGVTAYSSEEIDRIKGLHSDDVEAALGYPARTAVIHRDDMVRM